MTDGNKGLIARATLLAFALVLALPALAFADQKKGKGKGRGKPTEVFVNGHDARDGRTDRRGPDRDRHDRDDDDDDDRQGRGRGRGRDRDRDDDGYDDRFERRQVDSVAERNGFAAGLREGREDAARNERFNFQDESEYRDATSGYRDSYGNREFYRRNFREGFRRGYEQGYHGRTRRNDRDQDGVGDRRELAQAAAANGYQAGYEDGREDRAAGERFNYQDEGEYRDGTAGYRDSYGDRELYRRYFRQGFQRGYDDGYRGRSRRGGTGIGDILGGVFGRP